MPKSFLQKTLEDQRFAHGVDYVQMESRGLKKLNTTELAHLNKILTGHLHDDVDPWRFESTVVTLPTGHSENVNVISNPVARAREILGDSNQRAGNGEPKEAATDLYMRLVLEHLFKDANRRTALLAGYWILNSNNVAVDPFKLIKIPVGNLRSESEKKIFLLALKSHGL